MNRSVIIFALLTSSVAHAAPAIDAHLPGVSRYSRGSVTPVTVEILNDSKDRVTIDHLRFSGCAGIGTAQLKTPIVLEPRSRTRRKITIDTIVQSDAIPADCVPGDRWYRDVAVDYRVVP